MFSLFSYACKFEKRPRGVRHTPRPISIYCCATTIVPFPLDLRSGASQKGPSSQVDICWQSERCEVSTLLVVATEPVEMSLLDLR